MNRILYLGTRTFTFYGLVLCLVVALVPSRLVFADANKLFITPPSSQMNIGTPFTVNVRSYADTDATTGSVSGTVTFPASQLQITGISTAGSQYNAPSVSQGAGTIGFSASRTPAPSGSAQIFSVSFKAIGAGTATVNFSGDSRVNNATTTYTAGVYTITNPNPPAASTTPVATPKPVASVVAPVPIVTTNPSPSAQVTPTEPVATPDPTGLITGVAVTSLYSSSTIGWTVNAANPVSTFAYGSSSTQLDKNASVTKKPDGSFTTTITDLTPGVRYYFTISGNGDGNKSGTYSDTVTTTGFPVTMTITENNVPAKNAQIKINNRTYTTSSDGKKTIGLAAGSYTGTITTETASLTINLTIVTKTVPKDGTAPESQAVSYNLTSSPLAQAPGSENSIFAFVGILLGGTVVLGLGFVGFMAYRRHRFENGSPAHTSSTSTVVIQDGYDWRDQVQKPVTGAPSDYPSPNPGTINDATQRHNNSVHISDEEPLDMFEQAKQNHLPTPSDEITSDSRDENQQNPS